MGNANTHTVDHRHKLSGNQFEGGGGLIIGDIEHRRHKSPGEDLQIGESVNVSCVPHSTFRAANTEDDAVRLPTMFKYCDSSEPHALKDVFVAGTFNNWKLLPMVKSQKDFVATVDLKEGDYCYRYNVDGEWVNDPLAPIVTGDDGMKVNTIHVQKEDFNAFDALDMDSLASETTANSKAQISGISSKFGTEQPQYNDRAEPPVLPPQLLQVILNKDTPLSCEPTLLPEPNHVLINHLYALSIKDGVMVLSSTQRFRKKYVTTLVYKPLGKGESHE